MVCAMMWCVVYCGTLAAVRWVGGTLATVVW